MIEVFFLVVIALIALTFIASIVEAIKYRDYGLALFVFISALTIIPALIGMVVLLS